MSRTSIAFFPDTVASPETSVFFLLSRVFSR
jgi:hypothetical protein